MKERWDKFVENFEGEVEKIDGATISQIFTIDEKNLEIYYLMIDEEGFEGLDEGVYVAINKTLKEWTLDLNLQKDVSYIVVDHFFEPKIQPKGYIDLERTISTTPVGYRASGNEKWLIVRLQTLHPANIEALLGVISPGKGLCLN